MEQDKNINAANSTEENEIDLLELAAKLWANRRMFYKWCGIAAIVGLIIGFSIPKVYTTEVKLSPEEGGGSSSSLGSLASMAGVNLGSGSDGEAVYPDLYPDVVNSIPFITDLFDVKVRTETDEPEVTLQDYMKNDTRSAWWSYILGVPGKIIGLFKSDEDVPADHVLNTFRLTRKEYEMVQGLKGCIDTSIDSKTSVITIKVTTQNPLVSAMLADSVVTQLQKYITAYRTNKSRQDLEYTELLNDEARVNYYEAQQRYAEYLDRNQGVILHSAQVTRERLQNEAQLAFNLYNQTSQKLQLARAKVQETTPAYAIITPATVPVRASGPRKMLILAGCIFLAFVACAAWILFVGPALQSIKDNKAATAAGEDFSDLTVDNGDSK